MNYSAKKLHPRHLLFTLFLLPLQAQELKQLDAVMNEAREDAGIPAIGAVAFDTDKVLLLKTIGSTRSDQEITITQLLKQASYQKLHTPVQNNYALGWGTITQNGKVTQLSHDGSNTMWYARATLDLSQNKGFCIIVNTGDPKAVSWLSKIATALQPAKK